MRAELRALRKEHVKPVSRMRKGDIASELERLKGARESTPAAAAVPSAETKHAAPAKASVKEMKEHEFPVKPKMGTKKGMERKTARKAYEDVPAAPKKKGLSKAMMMKMLAELSSDEE